ncbi:hypothetical protein NPX13_g9996 [Xylaria arbuscula]|uniref:Uncharacterized protein n=1 Tax=Xylaria arbuscula TaxID=114810 RepID=A0A9W8TGZ3_9PEZI|nr:hypothetical protein NPX13_g9996 [Xylaria arbuscula]
MGNVLKLRELRRRGIPDLQPVDIIAHNLAQMRRQRGPVNLLAAAALANALVDLDDDAREPVLVDVDLLVVGYLA